MFDKIKKWYKGKYIPPDMSGGIAFMGHYEQPRIIKAIKPYVNFWVRHWHILLPTFTAAAVALFIHFHTCSNSAGESKQIENHQITTTNHVPSKQ